MTTTIFLHDVHTLRVSFPYSAAAVDAIKTVGGATWDKAAKVWYAPVAKLDAILRVFGDDCAVAPDAAMAAAPKLPIEHFAATCAAAGVSLRVEGPRVQGSGGCWTPILQAEIDKRAAQLRRLLEGGWQAPQAAPPPAAAPEPASYDLITHLDRVIAKGEQNARIAAEKEAGYKEAARRKRFDTMRQASLLEVEA